MGGTISIGDLNGDSRTDAFVAGCCFGINPAEPGYDFPNAPSVSWVWINQGSAESKNPPTGYILPMDFLDGRPIRQVALGDLEGDGDLDIFAAVGYPTIGTVDSTDDLILLNDGTGLFTAFEQQLGNTDSTSVALGDVNRDGQLDALVGTNHGASLWINQHAKIEIDGPTFVQSEQSFTVIRTIQDKLKAWFGVTVEKLLGIYLPYGSIRTKAVFLVDLDGDEDLDALLGRIWGAQIWWNDGHGTFTRSGLHFKYREDTGLAVDDFDGDGDQDIFLGRNEGDYQVWWNNGKGVFDPYSR
jgi:hypothetical protein